MVKTFIKIIVFCVPLSLSARNVSPGFGITGLWGINMFGTNIKYVQGEEGVYVSSFAPGYLSNIGIFFNITREDNEKLPSYSVDLHIAPASKTFCVTLSNTFDDEGTNIPHHFCKFNLNGFDIPLLWTIFFSSGPYLSIGWVFGMGYFFLTKEASYEISIPKKIPQKETTKIMNRSLAKYNISFYTGFSFVFLDQITKLNVLYSLSFFNHVVDNKEVFDTDHVEGDLQSDSNYKLLGLKEIFGGDSTIGCLNHSISLQLQINFWRIIEG